MDSTNRSSANMDSTINFDDPNFPLFDNSSSANQSSTNKNSTNMESTNSSSAKTQSTNNPTNSSSNTQHIPLGEPGPNILDFDSLLDYFEYCNRHEYKPAEEVDYRMLDSDKDFTTLMSDAPDFMGDALDWGNAEMQESVDPVTENARPVAKNVKNPASIQPPPRPRPRSRPHPHPQPFNHQQIPRSHVSNPPSGSSSTQPSN